MMTAIRGWASGKVQGVGFRQFTYDMATEHGLAGYVKNLSDGRVEFFLQGEGDAVAQVLVLVEQGPRWARVTQCEHKPIDANNGLSRFELRY